jgi:hypothetical protein
VDKPPELANRSLVAFSYFYDRAVEAAIVPATGGRVTVHHFTQVTYTAQ